MTDDLVLSRELLRALDVVLDPIGELAWCTLRHADPTIREAWVDHHFHWTRACRAAELELRDRGFGVGLRLHWHGVSTQPDFEDEPCRVEYQIEIHRPRGRLRIDSTEEGHSFAQVMLRISSASRLADRVELAILESD